MTMEQRSLDGSMERRFIPATELRVKEDRRGALIEGYAALFNTRSEGLPGFTEVIQPGAFAKAIQSSDVRALWNHNPDYVLGRVKSGTLEIVEDERGLKITNTPPDTQWARDLMVSMRRGDVDQMSFTFKLARGGATWKEENGTLIRTIHEMAEVGDVSPVTYPAYPDTSVAVRSLEEWRASNWKAMLEEQTAAKLEAMRR
jgi:HK97 family phage prohead protease